MEQHDSHVRLARAARTVFMCEIAPGQSIELRASWLLSDEQICWAALRMVEGKRMELDGSWRADLARLERQIDERKSVN